MQEKKCTIHKFHSLSHEHFWGWGIVNGRNCSPRQFIFILLTSPN